MMNQLSQLYNSGELVPDTCTENHLTRAASMHPPVHRVPVGYENSPRVFMMLSVFGEVVAKLPFSVRLDVGRGEKTVKT